MISGRSLRLNFGTKRTVDRFPLLERCELLELLYWSLISSSALHRPPKSTVGVRPLLIFHAGRRITRLVDNTWTFRLGFRCGSWHRCGHLDQLAGNGRIKGGGASNCWRSAAPLCRNFLLLLFKARLQGLVELLLQTLVLVDDRVDKLPTKRCRDLML